MADPAEVGCTCKTHARRVSRIQHEKTNVNYLINSVSYCVYVNMLYLEHIGLIK